MEVVSKSRSQVGESPFWSVAEGRMYWSDLRGQFVRWFNPETGEENAVSFAEPVAAAIPDAGGDIAVLLASGLFTRCDTTGWRMLSKPEDLPPVHRFNDATVDPKGRLIAGTMLERPHVEGPSGRLYAFDGKFWRCLAKGFRTINGLAFAPDGCRLYISDSHAEQSRVWIAEYDPRDGNIGALKQFVCLMPAAGRPDGAAVDLEGGYWIAAVGGGRILRFDHVGRQTHSIDMPVRYPTKVAFGGPGLNTAYVTSMVTPDPNGRQADDGALFAFEAPLPGYPVPPLKLSQGRTNFGSIQQGDIRAR